MLSITVVPGTYYCCYKYRCTCVLKTHTPRYKKGSIPKKKAFHTNVNPKMGTRKKISGGKCLRKLWKPLPSRGPSKPSLGGHLSTPPRRQVGLSCIVANAWYNCSTRSHMGSEFGVSPRERPSGKKRQVLCLFGPAGRTRASRERPPYGRQL